MIHWQLIPWVKSWRLLARLAGALCLAMLGIQIGHTFFALLTVHPTLYGNNLAQAVGALIGLVFGFALTPALTLDLSSYLSHQLMRLPLPILIGGVVGILIGGGIGLAGAWIFTLSLGPLSWVVAIITVTLGSKIGWELGTGHPTLHDLPLAPTSARLVLDSSILIDSRCWNILESGLGAGFILIPQGVLNELQKLADDQNSKTRSAKGKYALLLVERLRTYFGSRCLIIDDPSLSHEDADNQVLQLARSRAGLLLTTDGPLTKLATIANIPVLNPNQFLSTAQPTWKVGDQLELPITGKGRRPGQGVTQTPDGLLVIVEQASTYIGTEQKMTINNILPTPTGVVIFAELNIKRKPHISA